MILAGLGISAIIVIGIILLILMILLPIVIPVVVGAFLLALFVKLVGSVRVYKTLHSRQRPHPLR